MFAMRRMTMAMAMAGGYAIAVAHFGRQLGQFNGRGDLMRMSVAQMPANVLDLVQHLRVLLAQLSADVLQLDQFLSPHLIIVHFAFGFFRF